MLDLMDEWSTGGIPVKPGLVTRVDHYVKHCTKLWCRLEIQCRLRADQDSRQQSPCVQGDTKQWLFSLHLNI